MKQLYEGPLGIFEYDNDEVEICYDSSSSKYGFEAVRWLGKSNSVTIKGILYSIDRMFKGKSLPEGFTLNLVVKELERAVCCFEECHIPKHFILELNTDRDCTFYGMFRGAFIADDFDIRITGDFKHSFAYMFSNCDIHDRFNFDIPLKYGVDIESMFGKAKFHKAINWTLDISGAENCSGLFYGFKFPENSYLALVGNSVGKADFMFEGAEISTGTVLDLSKLCPGDLSEMFSQADIYEGSDIRLNLCNAYTIKLMFDGAQFYGNYNLDLFVPTNIIADAVFENAAISDLSTINFKLLHEDMLPPELVESYVNKITVSAHKSLEELAVEQDTEADSKQHETALSLVDLSGMDLELLEPDLPNMDKF